MQRLAPPFSPRAAQVLAGLPAADRPALWVADRLAPTGAAAHPSGFAALDAELPGGGWPAAGLTELLLEAPGSGELRLLAPLLGQTDRHAGSLLCIAPPFIPYAPAWRALSLPLDRLVLVTPGNLADAAWAAEQGLRSGACSAVLWWQGAVLPGYAKAVAHPKSRLSQRGGSSRDGGVAGAFGSTGGPASAAALATVLRRLHLASQENACPVFAVRPASARGQSSPAPLRLLLEPQAQGQLAVSVFKRRGPAMAAAPWLSLPVAGLLRRGLRRAALPPAPPARPVLPLPEPADVVVCAAPERIAA